MLRLSSQLGKVALGVAIFVIFAIAISRDNWDNYLSVSANYLKTSLSGTREVDPKTALLNCHVQPLQNYSQFFGLSNQTMYPCKHLKMFGGVKHRDFFDGDKWACMDSPLAPPPTRCLVYSFGINNEWSFDDAMAAYGCQVFSFDPSMAAGDHQRSANVTFFRMGVGSKSGKFMNGKVDRLGGIMKKLGHVGRKIDYLKMDIEGMEVETLEEVLEHQPEILASVTHLGLEIHPGVAIGNNEIARQPTNIFNRLWRIFQQLECLGFRLLRWARNDFKLNHYTWNHSLQSKCYEIVWVKPPTH
ncbi:probable methyltransferase-like protein 24 [Procambarus clarkii]|uniref:probable methyltransferase-like protein 24 n=1 Tax=Procambarus clarkii TaxID=6728 RepID=UPI00374242CF